MSVYEYYQSQSKLSYPGHYDYLYEDLPDDVSQLCSILQGLFMHYSDQEIFTYDIPEHRFHELDDRYTENILARIMSHNPMPLCYQRDVDERVIGVCRDMSLLLCSILRYKNIPARLRSGFANYYHPEIFLDAVYVEYWNEKRGRWCVVDSRTSPLVVEKYKLNIDFDLHDIPLDSFIPAEKAWYLCRSGQFKANRFGSRQHRGLWYVRNRLLHELAYINKNEMLMWDLWGLMLCHQDGTPTVTDEQFPMLDEVQRTISNHSRNIPILNKLYENHDELCVLDSVNVFNPFIKRRIEHVDVK